jgi:hypothetical protein
MFNFALGDLIAYFYPNTDRVMERDFSGVTACGFMYF